VTPRKDHKLNPTAHGPRRLSTYFGMTLGPYESEEAIATLPAQLDLLRIFQDLGREDVALIYRFATEPEPEGDLAPRFKFLCVGRQEDSLLRAEASSLFDHASVTFVPAWALANVISEPSRATLVYPALPPAEYRTRLQPTTTGSLPNKPDWSPLIDLLRRRDEPMVVDLVCLSVPSRTPTAPFSAVSVVGHGDHTAVSGPYPVVPANHQQEAAAFFAAITQPGLLSSPRHDLLMHVVVHSASPLDDVLAHIVGRLILGLAVKPTIARRNVVFPMQRVEVGVQGSPEEVIRAFHPPYGHIQGRGLSGFRPLDRSLRFRVPKNAGAAIGFGRREGPREDVPVPVRLSPSDRLKHIYVIGKTGSGKTNLLKNIVREDIAAGEGVAVIDPHGGLVDSVLAHIGDRIDDTILLDFSDPEYLPVLNPLIMDVGTPADYDLAVEELIEVMIRRTYNEYTGPVFEDTVRMLLASIATGPLKALGTPSIAAGVEIFRQPDARKWIAKELSASQPLLSQQWATFNGMLPTTISEQARWVLAKFAEFSPSGVLYSVTGGAGSRLSLSSVFDERKVLLVKIPESVIGGRAAGFLGALVFARLHRAALSHLPDAQDSRGPFHLHVDEFQKFVAADIEELIAEARKFNLSLTVAHQNMRQLDAFSRYEGSASSRLREALFSNVGTMICMRMSGSDVGIIAQEFGISARDVQRIQQYQGLVRAVVGGVEREPFTLQVPNADLDKGDQRIGAEIRRRMISQGLWRARGDLVAEVAESIKCYESAWKNASSIASGVSRRVGQQQTESSFLDEWLEKRKPRGTRPSETEDEAGESDSILSPKRDMTVS
jgi:hypothetical protein